MSLKDLFPIDEWNFHSGVVMNSLSPDELERLGANRTEHLYKKGEVVFREGAIATGVYLIRSGKVKKYRMDRQGNEQIIYVANTGELIGYHAVISGDRYPDSAATIEESLLSFIPRDDFSAAMEWSPLFTRRLLEALSHEYKVLSNSISVFARHSARERLAIVLIVLREKYKTADSNAETIVINLSRKDLASMAGIAEENVVRLLKDFKKEGLIETEGRKIRVVDVKALVKITNYG